MGASSKSGMGGPNTRAPGGQGRDYNGNAIGSNMPGQFAIGGAPRPIGGPAPIPGMPPQQGDLYQPGGNRFMPGGGMVPPAGARPQPGDMTGPYTRQRYPAGDPRRYGNPRQVNPGQPGLQPGPAPMPSPIENMPSPVPGRGKGGGGGKGGMPGPGMPVQRPGGQPIFSPGGPDFFGPFNGGDMSMDRFQSGGLPDRADGSDPYS